MLFEDPQAQERRSSVASSAAVARTATSDFDTPRASQDLDSLLDAGTAAGTPTRTPQRGSLRTRSSDAVASCGAHGMHEVTLERGGALRRLAQGVWPPHTTACKTFSSVLLNTAHSELPDLRNRPVF